MDDFDYEATRKAWCDVAEEYRGVGTSPEEARRKAGEQFDHTPEFISRYGAAGVRQMQQFDDPRRIAVSGKMAVHIIGHWELTADESIALCFNRERIASLMAIDLHLHSLFGKEFADKWIRSPNTNAIFGGDTPLNVMVRGGLVGIVEVLRYLEEANFGGFD